MIWDFQKLIVRRLVLWAGLSILVGLGLIILGGSFWQAFGIQAFAWGSADALIGWFGKRRVNQKTGDGTSYQGEVAEAVKIRKLLWINTALDVLYVAGGAAIVYFYGEGSQFWRGTGWGIVVQGGFLYTFDLWHALRVPEPFGLPHLPIFTHPDHEAFFFDCGKPAVLLVHGFPGTALEMRPLGQAFCEAGWTASGLRLPGFGSELADLMQYANEDWVDVVKNSLKSLQDQGHEPILLAGYSFGAALALQAAVQIPPDGLILIAPFTWDESSFGKIFADYFRALLPLSVQPFKFVPFDLPILSEKFRQYLPEIDLNEEAQIEELRHLAIPLSILDEVRKVGRQGLAAAPDVKTPTLIIRGTADQIIHKKWINALRQRLGSQVSYHEVDGPHSLTMPDNPAFEDAAAIMIRFSREILTQKPEETH